MKKSPLVYIMSPSYSGSTLLTWLLACHKKISTVGELKATSMGNIKSYKCSCGVFIGNCVFWQKVCEGMKERGALFSLDGFGTHFEDGSGFCNRLFKGSVRGRVFESGRTFFLGLNPVYSKKFQRVIKQNRRLMDVIMKIQGGEVFLDSSKEPVRLRHLMAAGHWDVKVIYLVRDGRGVANSFKSHTGVSMNSSINEWLHTQRELEKMYRRIDPEKSIKVVYEELCVDPEKSLERVFGFLGLEAMKGRPEFRSSEHHILGNAMRLKSAAEIELDEKWKTVLSSGELELFEKKAGKVNRNLGYRPWKSKK